MKVKILATGKSAVYGDAYAARLIEQRKAVPESAGGAKPEKAAKAEKIEKAERTAKAEKTEKAE